MPRATWRFQVPDRHRGVLADIADLDDASFKSLRDAIADADPHVYSRLIEVVTDAVGDGHQVNVEDVIEMLISVGLYPTRPGLTVDGVAETIVTDLGLEGEEGERLATRMHDLLSLEAVQLLAKSADLLTEHEHLFLEARVVSDIRPVFLGVEEEEGEHAAAAVLVHTLRLAYQDAKGRHDFYLALDRSDVEQLRSIAERALDKEVSLQALLTAADVPEIVFGFEEEGS
jgi:hypothetical protein